jgi:hypothetical protein
VTLLKRVLTLIIVPLSGIITNDARYIRVFLLSSVATVSAPPRPLRMFVVHVVRKYSDLYFGWGVHRFTVLSADVGSLSVNTPC